MTQTEDILDFWFGRIDAEGAVQASRQRRWFVKDPEFDREVGDRFGSAVTALLATGPTHWRNAARDRLAAIIALDQFTRNIYRGTAESFKGDAIALELCLEGIDRGHDLALRPIERAFLFMPLEHSESRAMQILSLAVFDQLVLASPSHTTILSFRDYAIKHKAIIDRFGRFPHRNGILNRPSTESELAFLEQPGSGF